jgi:hypothetical protein
VAGNEEVLSNSLSQLITSYGKLKFNFYLIKVFRYFLESTMDDFEKEMLDKDNYNENNFLEFVSTISVAQNALCMAGGISLAIQVINNSVIPMKKLEGLKLINSMLKYGNKTVQDHLV